MKGDYVLSFIAITSIVVAVALSSGCVSSVPSLNIPISDITGHDTPIPRMQGFVRFHYENESCYMNVGYYKLGDHFDDVVKFYKSLNWDVVDESATSAPTTTVPVFGEVGVKKGDTIDLEKGNDTATVFISVATYKGHDITIVSIDYEKFCPSDGGEQAADENEYDSAVEVPLIGEANTLDKDVHPLLENVFDSVKAVHAVNIEGSTAIDYIVKRTIGPDDASALENQFENDGYSPVAQDVESDSFSLGFTKSHTMIQVGGDIGFQKITVTLMGG